MKTWICKAGEVEAAEAVEIVSLRLTVLIVRE